MTVFTRKQETRAGICLVIAIILSFLGALLGVFRNPTFLGVLIIALAFIIPFIRILVEQEDIKYR